MTELDNKVKRLPVRLSREEQSYINDFVLSANFPWYWQDSSVLKNVATSSEILPYYNGPYMSHILLIGAKNSNVSHLSRSPEEFSFAYSTFANIFIKFCSDNNINFDKIYRANLNLTWHNGDQHTQPHLDHDFPHKNFIMYLTTCNNGKTLIWDNNFKNNIMSDCEKNVAVTFDHLWHAHTYPIQGQKRVVFVVTYI